jgi:hypothetical protein
MSEDRLESHIIYGLKFKRQIHVSALLKSEFGLIKSNSVWFFYMIIIICTVVSTPGYFI